MIEFGRWKSISDVRAAHQKHWFELDAVRFFNTVVHDQMVGGRYFLTTDRPTLAQDRAWSIRAVDADANIDTVGEFMGFTSKNLALQWLGLHIRAVKTLHAGDWVRVTAAEGPVSVQIEREPEDGDEKFVVNGVRMWPADLLTMNVDLLAAEAQSR